jgi:hypothetical protein
MGSVIAASSSARISAMRFDTATELMLRTLVRTTDRKPQLVTSEA